MKKALYLFALLGITTAYAQPKEISRNWTSFAQTIDVSFVKKKMKFRVIGSAKAVTADSSAWSDIWATVVSKKGDKEGFDNNTDRRIKSDKWHTYVVEGEIDENSDRIYFGGMCNNNGQFYFDNFEFYVENEAGKFEQVDIKNAGFEEKAVNNAIAGWFEGGSYGKVRTKEFTFSSDDDSASGNYSLLVEGTRIEKDTSNIIGPVAGFTPQIGTLVTMLNNLSHRVEYTVQMLDQEETDFLMDEKANSVGALIMHLAAAEAYYQVFTFEGRGFNEEEKEKWQVALNLGEEARQKFKGHNIEYYLDIYREVRAKTIEELRKRDDKWLQEVQPKYEVNNHFCWFHVMEHQSSHLGQILLLQKRFPEEEELLPEQVVKDDY